MLKIGKIYKAELDDAVRLCADISMNGRGTTMWFSVKKEQADYFCSERSDAFVMALLPTAMREMHDICCETPMSKRLHYQLERYLVPTLAAMGSTYHPIKLNVPFTGEPVKNKGYVATGFSGGVDSLYTVMTHGEGCEYPVTHITHFNAGVFEGLGGKKGFDISCAAARKFAAEMNLEFVAVDTNIYQVIPKRYLDEYSFRNIACAMALQNAFGTYLLSDGRGAAKFSFDMHNSDSYDLLTVNCTQTESLSIHLCGIEVRRRDKIEALTKWEPAYGWLHSCTRTYVGEKNCGHCKKCIRDQVSLYALGALEKFAPVYDVDFFKKRLAQNIAFVRSHSNSTHSQEAVQLLAERNIKIPPAAYVYEKQFRLSMENLKKQKDQE